MKLTFDEALELINDEQQVNHSNVRADALKRVLWVAEWHLPGCMSESRSYCLRKSEAIDSCLSMAEGENGPPHGMKTSLRKYGRFDSRSPLFGTCINTVSRVTLGEIL